MSVLWGTLLSFLDVFSVRTCSGNLIQIFRRICYIIISDQSKVLYLCFSQQRLLSLDYGLQVQGLKE
jgi:hypothetical protein